MVNIGHSLLVKAGLNQHCFIVMIVREQRVCVVGVLEHNNKDPSNFFLLLQQKNV